MPPTMVSLKFDPVMSGRRKLICPRDQYIKTDFAVTKTAIKLRLDFDALFEGLIEFKSTYLELLFR